MQDGDDVATAGHDLRQVAGLCRVKRSNRGRAGSRSRPSSRSRPRLRPELRARALRAVRHAAQQAHRQRPQRRALPPAVCAHCALVMAAQEELTSRVGKTGFEAAKQM